MWEEPCISGDSGSGTVFFSGCSLSCVFCQNREISSSECGKALGEERLTEIFFELKIKGALNINLVTPDHFAPQIANAVIAAKGKGLDLPIVCNCSGYMSDETFDILSEIVDVWLPDFKFFNKETARRYAGAPDYPDVAKHAVSRMYEQAGPPVLDENGIMQKGVLVRHLVLPGCEKESADIIDYLHSTYGDNIYTSIMSQYTVMPGIGDLYPELGRTLSRKKYDEIIDHAIDIGVNNAFIQEEGTESESFIPAFDYEGI